VPILTALARLVGWACLLSLLYFEVRGGVAQTLSEAAFRFTAAVLLAVLIANVVMDMTFALFERLANGFGHHFEHRGVTLDGKDYRERHFSDGTWMRTVRAADGTTICEWTDTLGACNRIETGPHERR